jgi:hypothetical protein
MIDKEIIYEVRGRISPRLNRRQLCWWLHIQESDIPNLIAIGALKPLTKSRSKRPVPRKGDNDPWLRRLSDMLHKMWIAKRRHLKTL